MREGMAALVATALMLAGTTALQAQPLPPMYGPIIEYEARAYHGRLPPPPAYAYPPEAAAIPPNEVAAILRSRGFLPLGGPVRRRGVYMVAAVHPSGDEGRLVIDAFTGRVVRFVPAPEVIRASRDDDMVLVYQGPTFPPPFRNARGVPRPPAPIPRVARRSPPAAPLVTPKPRPEAAPPRSETAQARPVPAPVESKPAAASPPLEKKPAESVSNSVVLPTQPMPPVQTME